MPTTCCGGLKVALAVPSVADQMNSKIPSILPPQHGSTY
jgi:hypothetical protein